MAANVSPQPSDWKTLYQLAILEVDPLKLPARISEARHAIIEQLEVNSVKSYGEQRDLNDALSGLHVVYQEFDDTFNVGSGGSSPMNDADYKVPFKSTGTINKVTIAVDPPKLTPDDVKKLEAASRSASD